jgi:hypothetical protein
VAPAAERHDFSIILGGPLYQTFRRARLSDDAMGLVHRRIAAAILVLWAPLVVLSALQGGLTGHAERSFLSDVGFQLRFLVVAPLLILSELVVHRYLRSTLQEFRVRSLIPPNEEPRLADAVREAAQWRNSVFAEVILLALVYAVGLLFTRQRYIALGTSGWYAAPAGQPGLSLAGLWLIFVSLPLLQFMLLRWYFRLFIWARFLWRVSRLDLDLDVIHPDKAGGLGFLSDSLHAFTPIALAHGVLFAGAITDRVLYAGAKLTDYEVVVLAGAILLVLLFAGPLTVFAPRLEHVKRTGLRAYGALGQVYVREFREKWLGSGPPPDEPIMGSGDIQSLADLSNSFGAAEKMRIVPIRPLSALVFVLAFLLPLTPLLLTVMPAEKLIARLVGLVF